MYKRLLLITEIVLVAWIITGCGQYVRETENESLLTTLQASQNLPTNTFSTEVAELSSPDTDISMYAFSNSIDSERKYLFYVHGKIIEEQGIDAVDPEYGEYEYKAILDRLSEYGFIVVSEPRSKNTDSWSYAQKIAGQVRLLLKAGVPAKNITIVGASKGAWITTFVSNILENIEINYVIMGICNPESVMEFKNNFYSLYGNVLSIYDSMDKYGGPCDVLFSYSKDKGLNQHDEIVLTVGTGHGILYKPLDEWIIPAVDWANQQYTDKSKTP